MSLEERVEELEATVAAQGRALAQVIAALAEDGPAEEPRVTAEDRHRARKERLAARRGATA